MKKGFTLVELLAVIVILGLLAAITIPSVMNNIYATRDAAYNQLISEIEQTTQLYIRDNRSNLEGINEVGNTISITLQDLVYKEDLKTPVIDPRNDEEVNLSTQISINVTSKNKYSVTVGDFIYVNQ